MLPILVKFEFTSPGMQVVLALLCVGLTAYGAWAGWRGAGDRAHAPWRAAAYGTFAALVSTVAPIYALPPFSPGLVSAFKALIWGLAILLVVLSAAYGRAAAEKGEEGSRILQYGLVGAVVAFMAVRFGLGGAMGRGFGAPLHTYGLMIATAFIVAIWIASREAVRAYPGKVRVDGQLVDAGPVMRDHFLDLGFWVLLAAIAGSRLLFVIVNWRDYRNDPMQVFALQGGLVFYGGFLGALAASAWYARRHNLSLLRLGDVAIPSVAIGHMIGRFGCLSAGCCWGDIAKAGSWIAVRFPSSKHLPFGGFGADSLAFQEQAKDSRWVDAAGKLHELSVEGAQQISAVATATGYTMPVYPTQLMEATGELCLFLLLISLRRSKWFHGQILATWLVGYSILRTTVELFRGDLARGYLFRWPQVDPILLSTSQTISLAIFAAGVSLFAVYGRRAAGAAES